MARSIACDWLIKDRLISSDRTWLRLAPVQGVSHGKREPGKSKQDQGANGDKGTERVKAQEVRWGSLTRHHSENRQAEQNHTHTREKRVLWFFVHGLRLHVATVGPPEPWQVRIRQRGRPLAGTTASS